MNKKLKKIIFFFAAIVVLIRIGYICIGGELNKNYFISRELDLSNAVEYPCKDIAVHFSSEYNRLNCLEILFTGIPENSVGKIALQIVAGGDLIYQANISLANISNWEWKKVYINADIMQKDYTIYLDASDDCTETPNILLIPKNQAAPEAVYSYLGDKKINEHVAIQYGFLQTPSLADKYIVSSLWLILLLIIGVLLYYFEQISLFIKSVLTLIYSQVNKQIFTVVLEIFCCMIIINCSGINFQEPTKIILYFVSLYATSKIEAKQKIINGLCDTPAKKYALYFLYFYASFSLVGQRLFMYPLNLQITPVGIFIFFITILWFIPVIQTIFCLLEWLKKVSNSNNHSINRISFTGLMIIILLLPALYNLFANNPGISSVDSALTLAENAHHLRGSDNWHPFFYNAVLGCIIKIWDSTYAVILAQYIFWTYVMLEFFFYLKEKGVRDSILICTALFTGFNAANFIHLNTIWKDIPYAISLLWTFVLLAKLSIDTEKYQKKWYIYLELFLSLIGVYFYRKNGIVPFITIIIMLVIIHRKNIKIWCTLTLTIASIMIIRGPIYSYFEVVDNGSAGMYIGLSQDILGTYYAGGEVSESTLQMINVMTGGNNLEYNYIPSWAYQTYDLHVEPQEFIKSYIDTFFKNPVLMIRAIINREDALWNIYAGEGSLLGCVDYHGTIDDSEYNWNFYYPKRTFVSLYDSMAAATKYTANSQWISAIEWRCGIFTLLGLIAIIYIFMKKGNIKYILITAPIIGQIISLLLSTGWSDFRYFWPLNLMNMCMVLISIIIVKAEKNN